MGVKEVLLAIVLGTCCVVFSVTIVFGIVNYASVSPVVPLAAIIGFFIISMVGLQVVGDPDHASARQINRILELVSETLPFMSQGLTVKSAQSVCNLLLPNVKAHAVALTDHEKVLGFAGVDHENHMPNSSIQTDATRLTLEDGRTRVVDTSHAVGFAHDTGKLCAGIITPLVVNKRVVGTLKFYYKSRRRLNDNQKAMAEGFAQILSTQLSLSYLQQQTELAAQMELRALQAQINPHFLFNTINTIAAVTRMDPAKARTMLREFAVYYRRLLENSEDLIPLAAEIEQTERYLMFQKARFGEENIVMETDIEPGLENVRVPAFIVQPIVENAVGHARRDDGSPLHITVRVYHASDSVIISIADDGVGIPADRLEHLVDGSSEAHMGIALKNVNARLKAYFGTISGLYIDSKVGVGTTAYLSLYDVLDRQHLGAEEDDVRGDDAELEAADADPEGVRAPKSEARGTVFHSLKK